MKHYIQLEEQIAKIGRINNIINLLTWDTAVNMPSGSADNRIKDITTLTSITRSILTSAKTIELIERVSETTDQLNDWQLANLREIKRELSHALSIEDSLQKRFILSTTQCELVWRQAKVENNYAKLKPYLQSVLDCVKEIAASKSQKLNCSNYYDALVDTCDPNGNTADIKRIYAVLT